MATNNNPSVIRAAIRDVAGAYPDWNTLQIDEAIGALDGLLSMTGDGRLHVDTSTEDKFQKVLRVAPKLVDRLEAQNDAAKIANARIAEARKREKPPAPEFAPEAAAAEIAKIPPLSAGASDRMRAERALKVEQAYRAANFTESDPTNPEGY